VKHNQDRLRIVNVNNNNVVLNTPDELKKLINDPLRYFNYIEDSKCIVKLNGKVVDNSFEFKFIAPEIVETDQMTNN